MMKYETWINRLIQYANELRLMSRYWGALCALLIMASHSFSLAFQPRIQGTMRTRRSKRSWREKEREREKEKKKKSRENRRHHFAKSLCILNRVFHVNQFGEHKKREDSADCNNKSQNTMFTSIHWSHYPLTRVYSISHSAFAHWFQSSYLFPKGFHVKYISVDKF